MRRQYLIQYSHKNSTVFELVPSKALEVFLWEDVPVTQNSPNVEMFFCQMGC